MLLTRIADAAVRADDTSTSDSEAAFDRLMRGEKLSEAGAEALFAALVAGALDETAIAAMLVTLRLRGESAEVLIGGARALRAADRDFPRPDYAFADSCGTGGDGSSSINVSTAVAFVAAACGLPIAKHGNRSFSSKCGSADVLQEMGAVIDMPPERSRALLDELGFCFLFAPAYHPGLKHAGPVRRRLKVPTVMNLLGPCLNPAEPPVQLLGVAEPKLLEPIAQTLASLGVERALVVHGSGLDEVALHGPTQAVLVSGGALEPMTLTPEEAGLSRVAVDSVRGGGPAENAARLQALLAGHGRAADRDLVAINAGALLFAAGRAVDLREGAAQATDALRSGAAGKLLGKYVEASRG